MGLCIYCDKSGETHKLTDEHIFPFALGGNLILPQSSCVPCQRITGQFEQVVLRGALRGIKERLALQSRTKKRPKTLPLFAINGDETRKIDVKVEHYPATVALPTIAGPTLDGAHSPPIQANTPWAYTPPIDVETLSKTYGIRSFATNAIDVAAFARMLAKIAHAGAVAELGLSAFYPCLPRVISNSVARGYERFMGTWPDTEQPEQPGDVIHRMQFGTEVVGNHRYLVARLTLFSNFGAPSYRVIVGQKSEDYAPMTCPIWRPIVSKESLIPERYRLNISFRPAP